MYYPDAHSTSLTDMLLFLSELLIMKEGLYAAMPGPYGDWSRYVSGVSWFLSFNSMCSSIIHFQGIYTMMLTHSFCWQLERRSHQMGPVFPDPSHNNRQVPLSGWRERAAAGGPWEGRFQDVSLLLQNFKGHCRTKLTLPDLCQVFENPLCSKAILTLFNQNYRKKSRWPRSEMWKEWAFLRSSMESPCASYSTCQQASGLHTLLSMLNPPV